MQSNLLKIYEVHLHNVSKILEVFFEVHLSPYCKCYQSNVCIYPAPPHKQDATQGQFFKTEFNRFEFYIQESFQLLGNFLLQISRTWKNYYCTMLHQAVSLIEWLIEREKTSFSKDW